MIVSFLPTNGVLRLDEDAIGGSLMSNNVGGIYCSSADLGCNHLSKYLSSKTIFAKVKIYLFCKIKKSIFVFTKTLLREDT